MNNLPIEFPEEIQVRIHKGEHRGKTQWQGIHQLSGKQYRLVIDMQWHHEPSNGDTWLVYPKSSPNGHVVFCSPGSPLKTASGEHPFLVKLKKNHVKPGCKVSVLISGRGRRMEAIEGALDRCEAEDSYLMVYLRGKDCVRIWTSIRDFKWDPGRRSSVRGILAQDDSKVDIFF